MHHQRDSRIPWERLASRCLLVLFAALFVVPARGLAAIPAAEREALETLYLSTSGSHWFRKDGWMGPPGSECSPSGWYGLQCDATGTHVVSLTLSNNGLAGILPAQVADLSHLTTLRLNTNALQ